MYIDLDTVLNETFGGYCQQRISGFYGQRREGLRHTRLPKQLEKAVFNYSVPVGSRFNLGNFNYQVTEVISFSRIYLCCM